MTDEEIKALFNRAKAEVLEIINPRLAELKAENRALRAELSQVRAGASINDQDQMMQHRYGVQPRMIQR